MSDLLSEIEGCKPVDPKLMEAFEKEMTEKVIPEIIASQNEQARLAQIARLGLTSTIQRIQNEARIDADTNWTMYQAWLKRATEAETREAELAAKLVTVEADNARYKAALEKIGSILRPVAGTPGTLQQLHDIAREALTSEVKEK